MKHTLWRHILCPVLLLGFLLGSYNGRLAVWKDDDPEPYRVYPCPVYLLPKAEYKKYMQFFIGIFVVVLLLKPVLEFIYMDNLTWVYEMFQTFNTQIENVELDMEENIYEYFFFKGEGE